MSDKDSDTEDDFWMPSRECQEIHRVDRRGSDLHVITKADGLRRAGTWYFPKIYLYFLCNELVDSFFLLLYKMR